MKQLITLLLALLSTASSYMVQENAPYVYETKWYNQTLDHFSFVNDSKFPQRYLINDTWWKTNNGPIFFYAGNEGDVEAFAQNSGFMWDIAPEFGAMLVFAEHRYYGKTLPFGANSLKPNPVFNGYLSSEQALADYAELLTHLKATIKGADKSPVIAFGGSYGGMLASWFRIKFPHVVDGAIAASAPIAQFDTPCDAFMRIVTSDFTDAGCSETIKKSWKAIDEVAKNDTGKKWMSERFGMCKTMKTNDDVKQLKAYLNDMYGSIAMMDYPYSTSFLMPLPGYPVQAVCDNINLEGSTNKNKDENKKIVDQIVAGASIYYNYTGETKCLDFADPDDIGAQMWAYQSCTEMVMPMCSDGVNDMFEPSSWNLEQYIADCQKVWKATPRPKMADIMYGAKKLHGASNIVFSNGLLDPWSSGGIMRSVNPTVVSVIIPKGAHHLDLRGSNPNDPVEVVQARKMEKEHIAKWINEAYMNNKVSFNGPNLNNLPFH